MNPAGKGTILSEGIRTVHEDKFDELATALDTETSATTAAFLPWFGVVLTGEGAVGRALEADASRSFMVGQAYEWTRPFIAGEKVSVRVVVEDVYTRGTNDFAVVLSEFRDASDQLIQRQRATFIEMGRPAAAGKE